jgi:hypothetical protein
MTYVGITPDGKRILLPKPVSMKLNHSEDAPADGFSGVFPLARSGVYLTQLQIYGANGKLCFDGIVDDQTEVYGDGILLTLAARSRAALLLDNEAIPQNYCMPSLGTVFQRHIQPYGFSGYEGNSRVFPGKLEVTKGMSEWQAAEAFCTKYLKVRPRIAGGRFIASNSLPKETLLFDREHGIPYASVSVRNKYCGLYSELFVKNGNGYSPVARDELALSLGTARRRLLSEGADVDELIRSAHKKAFSVTVTCPGEVPGELMMKAVLRDKALEISESLYVSEIECALDSAGETTRFVLRRV